MCLIVFAWQKHARHALVLAANRDEFHRRATQSARFWDDAPELLAGRDLQAGGTWLGVSRQGRFAAITNFRELRTPPVDVLSRGELVSAYLRSNEDPERWLRQLQPRFARFAGFNLLLGTPEQLLYYSNRNGPARALEAGVYGLSNHLLDTPWPKVIRAKRVLAERVAEDRVSHEALAQVMMDQTSPNDHELPDTGVGLELERRLGSVFIDSPGYGTRCVTALTLDCATGVHFSEQTTAPVPGGRLSYRFGI